MSSYAQSIFINDKNLLLAFRHFWLEVFGGKNFNFIRFKRGGVCVTLPPPFYSLVYIYLFCYLIGKIIKRGIIEGAKILDINMIWSMYRVTHKG